jgi:hypothetical protein
MDPPHPESPQLQELPSIPHVSPGSRGGAPGVRWVLVRAIALGLLIVLVVIALVWLAAIPVLSIMHGSGSTGPAMPVTPRPSVDGATPSAAALAPVTGSVEFLPHDYDVLFSVQPKDSAGRVTVQFDGGRGRSFVKEVEVSLTRPDGTVVTGLMGMQAEFPEVILQGSRGTDRVAVFVRFLSGKTYKVMDEQVPYRKYS